MSMLVFQAERSAKFLTKQIGRYWGESFPFYYVSEFPKSGGTWLASMLSDYLQLPFPRMIRLPVGFSCVLQNHWTYDPRLRRVTTIYRDGRDVMSSFFYDKIRTGQHSQDAANYKIQKIYLKLFGRNPVPEDIVELLPRFLEYEFTNPGRGVHAAWPDFVLGWHNKPHVVSVSYEELLQDGVQALRRVVEELTGEEADNWRLETAVEKFSFERVTGRKRGTADITQHARKAIIGDWKNTFSREAAEIFNEYAGDALIELGYESDKQWIDRTEFTA
ncbi:MAG: sulfotransferase domain-containing protein [Pirellulales bacterium]|nr:sulfotransferase domain-containing protein [Pirellulales bacterium]